MRTGIAQVVLSILTLAPIGTLAVGCFSGGQQGDCSQFISQFCKDETQGLLSGETRSMCYNLGEGVKCDFAIQNNNGETSSADIGNCISVNTATNNGCHSHGGIASSEGFLFTLDPNAGIC